MVRRAEGSLAHESVSGGEQAGHAPHRGDLDRLLEREGRQEGPEAAREHGLARAGRPQHQQIMSARRRDLESALGPDMSPHIREIEPIGVQVHVPAGSPGPMRGNLPLAIQVLEGVVKRTERDHGDSTHHRRLLGITRGHEETRHAPAPAMERDGQHTSHGLDSPVEGQLT